MTRDKVLQLLDVVTDEAPYAHQNAHDGLECVGAAEDWLASYEALVEAYDSPEHIAPQDVTAEMLAGWQTMLDELCRIIRASGHDLADARMHLERVAHYFDDAATRVA